MTSPNAFYLDDHVEVGHRRVPGVIDAFTEDGKVRVTLWATGATVTVPFTHLHRPEGTR